MSEARKMGIKERKEREKEARRDDILDAAEKVFFQKGITGTTMDEVAERAELAKGTLYLYYKRKEDLCMGIICRGKERIPAMGELNSRIVEAPSPKRLQEPRSSPCRSR